MGDIDKIVAAILAAATDYDPSGAGGAFRVSSYLQIRKQLEKAEIIRRGEATEHSSAEIMPNTR
jgi:hypothetical protein